MSENGIQEGNKQISQTLLQNLYEQRAGKSFCDVKLTVEGSEIWCHACVLASCSYYFKELLQKDCSSESHWCLRNPLEINISKEVKKCVDLCLVCITKIVDSMYLKELVVVKEHLEHFSQIVKFFKIVDLLPLCVAHLNNGNESYKNSRLVHPKHHNNAEKRSFVYNDGCKASERNPVSQDNVKKDKNLLKEKKNDNTDISLKEANNSNTEVSPNDFLKKSEVTADHNYVINEPVKNQQCEFVCCNYFETPTPMEGESQSGKRVLRCEVCTLSTVSVRKMLKHVENSKHFGNICSICYLKFPSTDLVRDHLKDHFDAKPYICHICLKRNRLWEQHKLHYKVHCKNKEFSCSICEKSFKHKSALYAHMKYHRQVNPLETENVEQSSQSREISAADSSNKLYCANKTGGPSEKKLFYCQLCNEGFTLKKNLKRHSHLKHWTKDHLQCSGCNYQTKRSDLLKQHMKKYHKELVVEETFKSKPKPKKKFKQDKSPIVGVMIPVQLVSTTDSLALNGFVVEKNEEATRQLQNEQHFLDSKTSHPNSVCSNEIDYTSFKPLTSEIENNVTNDPTTVQIDCSPLMLEDQLLNSSSIKSKITHTDGKDSCTVNVEVSKSDLESKSGDYEMADSHVKCSNNDFEHIENSSTSSLSRIWLNEATGELLNESNFLSVRLVDSSLMENHSQSKTVAENSLLDMNRPLQALILNEMSSGIPLLDFTDDADNFQSNPQTPQTSMVEIEDTDNLFSLNYLDANFYSTWVLNEATGELNMVSFNMQSLKDSESLKLDENTGRTCSVDDDDTALFLNEGTGDLSVIYFNPNKCDHNIVDHPMEQANQEDQDNMSEHSNDERDDVLNEEFLIASANFMAYEENETFLNELTGEFDTALGQYQSGEEKHLPENMYLNEETGEISWNVLDKNIGRDFFTNGENLNFDFDEALNYEDFDLNEDINDFQFQSSFGLDTTISNDWHDDPCDTLLNECTGEFVTKE